MGDAWQQGGNLLVHFPRKDKGEVQYGYVDDYIEGEEGRFSGQYLFTDDTYKLNLTDMEQILINYTKTEDSFLLAIVNGEKSKVFTDETQEAVELVNAIKNIIEIE